MIAEEGGWKVKVVVVREIALDVAEPPRAALVLAVLTPEEGIPTEKLRRVHGGNDPINNWRFSVSC